MVPHRKWNICRAYIGIPESGKTVSATAFLMELQRTPAYVLAHDASGNLPDKLPDGRPTGVLRCPTIEHAKKALASSPGAILSIQCQDAGQVIALAKQLGAASLKQGGGAQGVPVVVYFDEIVNVTDANPHRANANIKEMVTQRRHNHVGIVFGTQMPQLVHYSMLTLANEMVIFRCTGDRAIKNLEQAGVPPKTARKVIPTLPQYQSVTVRLGF